jgi:PRC-barrel domain
MTGKPLIESDRVEGTTVYDPAGNNIGSIKRLMIEKISGRVAYAVMSFGGFLGMGTEEHAVPWNKLTYDTNLGGYRTDITEQQLRGAPAFSRDSTYDWNDRNRERELHGPGRFQQHAHNGPGWVGQGRNGLWQPTVKISDKVRLNLEKFVWSSREK